MRCFDTPWLVGLYHQPARLNKEKLIVKGRFLSLLLVCTFGLFGLYSPRQAFAEGVVGTGTPASCTLEALSTAVASGGAVTFNCGPAAHTISVTTTLNISRNTSIDGGGLISLSGAVPSGYVISVNDDNVTLNLSNITIRDHSAGTPFAIGLTMFNRGTANLTNTTFLNNNRRAILNGGGTLTIVASRFEGNTSSASGSAISNESNSTLTVTGTTFHNNRAPVSYSGGAIYNSPDSRATITRSIFTENTAGNGGAIQTFGTMTIRDSTFTDNEAEGDGGAIDARSGGQLEVVNTTISGNSANRGGGFSAAGPLAGNSATLTNVTLANNTASSSGASIALFGTSGTITLRNTIVAGSAPNCLVQTTSGGSIVDGGNNLQFPGNTCGTGIRTANPRLGPLEDNGGFTLTHAIEENSPARNAANNANCPPFDQRGVVRPQGTTCDIGAFEFGAVPVLGAVTPACGPTGGSFMLTINGSNFIPGAKGTRVLLNGRALATTFVSPILLTAVVPAGAFTGRMPVAVQTPTVDGGTSTETFTLDVCSLVYLPLVNVSR